jgi:hypothetical protein
MNWLQPVANLASILTAVVAALAYGRYLIDRRRKRQKLEAYLEAEKAAERDRGQRSILHLIARLGLTEAELLDASFRSKHIIRRIAANPVNRRAEDLLLEYNESASLR